MPFKMLFFEASFAFFVISITSTSVENRLGFEPLTIEIFTKYLLKHFLHWDFVTVGVRVVGFLKKDETWPPQMQVPWYSKLMSTPVEYK